MHADTQLTNLRSSAVHCILRWICASSNRVHDCSFSPPFENHRIRQNQKYPDLPRSVAESNTGYVKIFEYVKGARITGTAPPNSTATLSIPILTNPGRTFEYVRTATATPDGTVTLIAPYSTDGPISIDDGRKQFDTAPSGMCTVTIAGMSHQVSVSEADVLAENVIGVT